MADFSEYDNEPMEFLDLLDSVKFSRKTLLCGETKRTTNIGNAF
jgi:hypothetical protein